MERLKTFFIYFLLIVGLYLFSQLIITMVIQTRCEWIETEVIAKEQVVASSKASGIDGVTNIQVINPFEKETNNRYLKIECYSKNDILQGTKYIQTGTILAKEKKEFEVRFNFERIKKVKVDLVDQIPENISEQDKQSDTQLQGVALLTAVFLLCFM